MLFNILKRDLKRKMGMNVIIVLFIILATMFIAGSVNNIIASITGVDNFMNMAGFTDGVALIIGNAEEDIVEKVDECESITDYKLETGTNLYSEDITVNGDDSIKIQVSTTIMQTPAESEIHYYKEDGSILTDINSGEVYVSATSMESNNLEVGDKITITLDDRSKDFTLAGSAKDAATGAKSTNFTRLFLSPEDYNYFADNCESAAIKQVTGIYYSTNDQRQVEIDLAENIQSNVFIYDRQTMRFSYVVDTIIAAILLVASIVLIIIAFVMVRFTIRLTISEEYREIGVMKAIGMKDSDIRIMYMTKYVIITVIGVVIGLILSFPFGDILLKLGLSAIVVDNSSAFIINIVCAIFTALITLLFCYTSTKSINKMSPVDAIRSGQTGERAAKKSPLKLSRSKAGCAPFMALNDILSSRKQFIIIGAVFALFVILTLMISTLANTLSSDGLFDTVGCASETDLIIVPGKEAETFILNKDGKENVEKYIKEIENTLAENDIPAKCAIEMMLGTRLIYDGYSKKMYGMYGVGTDMDMYKYSSGSAPQNEKEIALASNAAKVLGVEIGDKIQVEVNGIETDCMVTGIYESTINMGNNCRLYNGVDKSFEAATGLFGTAVIFTDNPNNAEIERRIELIKELYPDNEVETRSEYIDSIVGISDMLDIVKVALLLITLTIIILTVLLMEKSFIMKEKSQIALLKAEGFTNGFIYGWQLLRFVIISAAACLVGIALSQPVTELIANPIFGVMGLNTVIKYDIPWFENLVIYPLIIIGVTLLAAFLTALGTKKIKARDTSDIE